MTPGLRSKLQKIFAATQSENVLVLAAGILTITLFALTPTTTPVAIIEVDGLDIGLIRTVGGGALAIALILKLITEIASASIERRRAATGVGPAASLKPSFGVRANGRHEATANENGLMVTHISDVSSTKPFN
jgi:hypothetical protein